MELLIFDNGSLCKVAETYCTNNLNGMFLKELRDCGHKIAYCQFVSEKSNPICVFDLKEVEVDCVPLKICRLKLWQYCKAGLRLIGAIRKQDFIYFYYPNSLSYMAIVCWLLRKDYGCYIRGMQGVENTFSRWLYRHAKTVLTVADSFSEMVNKTTNRSLSHTIRPMIPYSVSDVETKRIYQTKEKYKILFLGRLNEQKGLCELMQAVKKLKTQGRYCFELWIVGGGDYEDCLKQIIVGLDISNDVKLMGAVTDDALKRNYFTSADLYILPTYHEGFPRTLYEAMIFGTPILTTFVGGIGSVMRDNYNCKRIEPRSVDSIVEGLCFAMDSYQQLGKYAQNATQTVVRILQRKSHATLLNDAINH